MLIVAVGVGSVLTLALIVWAGTRMVANPDPRAGGVGDSFGAGLAMFDPGAARASDDLADRLHQAEIVPTPDEHDDTPAWKVDLRRGTVKIPRSQ